MLGDHWRHPGQSGLATPPPEGDSSVLEPDTEWADELHDEDSDADDSVRRPRRDGEKLGPVSSHSEGALFVSALLCT